MVRSFYDDDMTQRPVLQKLAQPSSHHFKAPSKCINEGEDLHFFFTSKAYKDLSLWLMQLNLSMFPIKDEGDNTTEDHPESPASFSPPVHHLRTLLDKLSGLIDEAPPETGPRRFGNAAFRTWYRLVEAKAPDMLNGFLKTLPGFESIYDDMPELGDELQAYLIGSFGSAQRLDYGTGHELSFLAFLGCLWKLDIFHSGEERSLVVGLVQPYLNLIRRLIKTYTLEPAGSHGVWGLDDHSFLPYIFGSAQVSPAITPLTLVPPTTGSLPSAPAPGSVTDKAAVKALANENMYFSAIDFIHEVKRGPFWEHSPILYDISGIKDGWGKINKGMLKMYAAEVLGKFPVVQHFPFGSLFEWEMDPDASQRDEVRGSVHQRVMPKAESRGQKDVNEGAKGRDAGTKAPWARARNITPAVPQMQASTGVPTTRAPWTSGAGAGASLGQPAQSAAAATGMPATTAPWPKSNSTGGQLPPSTAAPWVSRAPPR